VIPVSPLRANILPPLLFVVVVGCAARLTTPQSLPSEGEGFSTYLPKGVTLAPRVDPGNLTVAQKLAELGARAEGGRLVDASGREIYCYQRFIPGTAPEPKEDAERQRRDAERLNGLREKYTVIVITTHGA
jgi:hypothetical protein